MTVDFTVENSRTLKLKDPEFYWNFGDGRSVTTKTPFASHNYENAVAATKPYSIVTATVSARGIEAKTRKSVSIPNPAYLTRKRGYVQPAVSTSHELWKRGKELVGDFSMRNHEEESMVFDQARLEEQFCDPKEKSKLYKIPLESVFKSMTPSQPIGQPAPRPAVQNIGPGANGVPPTVAAKGPVVIPSQNFITGRVTFTEDQFIPEVCGVAYHLRGKTKSGLATYASLYFQVRTNPLLTQKVDGKTSAFLSDLIKRKLVTDPEFISLEDLYRLEHAGKIRRGLSGWEVIP
jgi:hypothetical protein